MQYWFWWYHNPAKNDHEGDWEFIQVLFKADSVEAALADRPDVGRLRPTHRWRAKRWSRSEVGEGRRTAGRVPGSRIPRFILWQVPLPWVERARRLRVRHHRARNRRLDPTIVLLPDQVTDPEDEFAWLAFQGRWGQRESGFFNGPTGPYAKWRWDQPVTWSEGLRSSSVVIPGGDTAGNSVVSTFCRSVEVGSSFLAFAFRSPIVALTALAALGFAAIVLARRTRWSPVSTEPIVTRRASRPDRRRSDTGVAQSPTPDAVGRFHLHPGRLRHDAHPGGHSERCHSSMTWWISPVITVGSEHSSQCSVGGVGNLLAFVYVSAAVASTIGRSDRSDWSRDFRAPARRKK